MTGAERFLLSLFLKARQPETITGEYWNDVWRESLKRNPATVLQEFQNQGLLEPAPVSGLLDVKFRVPELVEICRKYGLNHRGKKGELIDRIVQSVAQAELSCYVSGVRALLCTESGREIGESFKREAVNKRQSAEKSVRTALQNRRFEDACRIVCQFEAVQAIPRGMGIDWKEIDPRLNLDEIRSVFRDAPHFDTANASETEQAEEDGRIAAAMGILWGVRADKFLPRKDGEAARKRRRKTPEEKEAEKQARMRAFAAQHESTLAQYRANRDVISGVQILCAHSSCDYCKSKAGQYNFENVPKLPHDGCTHDKGCRCCYTAIVKGF